MHRKLRNPDNLLILKKPFDNIEVTQLAHALTRKWTVTYQVDLQTMELQRELAWSTRVEQDLKASQERYLLAARGANDGLWDWDLERDNIYFSPRWKEMMGFAEGEIEADIAGWLTRVHPDDRDTLRNLLESVLAAGGPGDFKTEYRIRHKDGTYRWMVSKAGVLRSPEGEALRIAGSQTDVTANRAYDSLTSMPNRAYFIESVSRSLELRQTGSIPSPFGVMFIDLDGFKDVNDTLGHSAGDHLLVALARRLEQAVHSLRKPETLAG